MEYFDGDARCDQRSTRGDKQSQALGDFSEAERANHIFRDNPVTTDDRDSPPGRR